MEEQEPEKKSGKCWDEAYVGGVGSREEGEYPHTYAYMHALMSAHTHGY